ncbi:hypothetical protein SH580_00825 [Coraliomargarita algicola]|uniref:Uncharacterized protein n=1 Tax=Coraliomargarita algicola TaxID=3092156 RepID=A0ABZ0RTE5_9BACT|nr:hypothetical protein [Coraliomargarita sp. J2-16]WPJ96244.1 hypothetical protein SH580_00825 [Coraliomargarita sp. J2-16]
MHKAYTEEIRIIRSIETLEAIEAIELNCHSAAAASTSESSS